MLRKTGAPGAIPTRDLSLRRRALYATELREHKRKIVQRQFAVCQFLVESTHGRPYQSYLRI